MVTKRLFIVVLIVVLALPALVSTPFAGAQEEASGTARVRIGCFAFDPTGSTRSSTVNSYRVMGGKKGPGYFYIPSRTVRTSSIAVPLLHS
jgi:hypothetical protein